ncbi:5' nucleotidase, NT5C type [Bacillus testis]|uniref:5' nucleotidase, NT5C type n=1 Tax=Bacillus testis TaxID=1622072 RepID=UPI00067F41FE|nr:nucleotidase [Bacillus testis]
MKTKIHFGVDIDGTVTRPDSIIPFLNKDFSLELSLDDITEYDLTPFVPVSDQQLADWFSTNEGLIYQESPICNGASETLQQWSNLGELHYISARHEYLLPITLNWFKQHHIPYSSIDLIGSHNKIKAVKQLRIDLFFEDKFDNAVAISEECRIPVLLLDTPYNQGKLPDTVIRVHSWQEANQWVLQWAAGK